MSISAIGGSLDPYALNRLRQQELQTLNDAVQSGSTTVAQTAVAGSSVPGSANQPTSDSENYGTPISYAQQIKSDLSTLMSAVQSGDMSGAQAALKAYEQVQQGEDGSSGSQAANGTSHHHHHHHGSAGTVQSTNLSTSNDPNNTSGSGSNSTANSNGSVLNSTVNENGSDPLAALLQGIGNTIV